MFIFTVMGLRGGGVGSDSIWAYEVCVCRGGWRWVGACGSERWVAGGECFGCVRRSEVCVEV